MIGRRLITALVTLLVLGALAASVPAAVGKAMPHVKIPAKLRLLERRMRALLIDSERDAFEIVMRGPGVTPKHPYGSLRRRAHGKSPAMRPIGIAFLLSGVLEVSRSPFVAVARSRERRATESETRQIGRQQFEQRPAAAKIDGGRPWVLRNLEKPDEEGIQGLTGHAGNDGQRSLIGRLVNAITEATSVAEVGSAEVLGHQTTEFLIVRSNRRKRPERSFRVFFEQNGLPVRVEEVFRLGGKLALIVKIDVLATEIPISVQPPPPSETISEAELLKIEWPVVKGRGPGIRHRSRPRPQSKQ